MPRHPRGSKKRIFVPLLVLQSFIQTDIKILSEEYDVRTGKCRSLVGYARAVTAMLRADLVFCWFGSIRFFPLVLLARLFGKPVLIVAGGYDLANVPEIGYGNMRPGFRRIVGRALFALADVILCYSRSARNEAIAAGISPKRMRVLHLGVDVPDSVPMSKFPFVLTVASIDKETLLRKGLLDVARIARRLADVDFVLAGRGADPEATARMTAASPPNLRLVGYQEPEALASLFARAAVYLQPSRHEAFGLSVAEAMAYGCAVVVGNRYSLPEIVGETGVLVDPEDDEVMCAAIREALQRPDPRLDAAARIRQLFLPERRARELLKHVDALLTSRGAASPLLEPAEDLVQRSGVGLQ